MFAPAPQRGLPRFKPRGRDSRLKTSLKKRDGMIPRSAGTRAFFMKRSSIGMPFYGAVPMTAIDSDGFVLRRSLEQGTREAMQSSVIPVNVVSVVIYFAPLDRKSVV